jgi:hypothetical protein
MVAFVRATSRHLGAFICDAKGDGACKHAAHFRHPGRAAYSCPSPRAAGRGKSVRCSDSILNQLMLIHLSSSRRQLSIAVPGEPPKAAKPGTNNHKPFDLTLLRQD